MRVKTAVKSSIFIVRPIPSMVSASPLVMLDILNQVKRVGSTSARTPAITTQTGKRLVMV